MTARRRRNHSTEPAYSFLYEVAQLSAPQIDSSDAQQWLQVVNNVMEYPFNSRQGDAFISSFTRRLSLLWGPPGTGKTTVLAGIVLGWLEKAWAEGNSICIGVGSGNYNAIDNVLIDIADLLACRQSIPGHSLDPVSIIRVRSTSQKPPSDNRIQDVDSRSEDAQQIVTEMLHPSRCLIVGGTWRQFGTMAESVPPLGRPSARWFDLLLIDESSQVPVAHAAPYLLLLRENANMVLAGDDKQLGPIYGFQVEGVHNREGLLDCIFTYMKETHTVEPIALNQNYRTNDEIAAWPRDRFYLGDYAAFRPERRLDITIPNYDVNPPLDWPAQLPWTSQFLRILDPNWPVVVITYNPMTYTVSNTFEAQMVSALSYLYKRFLEQSPLNLNDEGFWRQRLGIVTPHRAQMSRIQNLLIEAAGMAVDPPPFVDTVDRFQGQERDLIIASYSVADKDFVRSEEAFILDPRRFNVTLTRARSKFIMFVNNAIVQHLPIDAQTAKNASHLQLFVMNYCSSLHETICLPFSEDGVYTNVECGLRVRSESL